MGEEVDIRSDLDNRGVALAKLIFRARQNFDIYVFIGENTSVIKQKRRSTFFGYIQREALDSLCLCICKIYEEPRKYEINSIPQMLKMISTMNLLNRDNFLDGLKLLGMEKNKVHQLRNITDSKLIIRGIAALQNLRPKTTSSEPLKKLIEIRDKCIAHPEYLTVEGVSGPSVNDMEALIEWSEKFLNFVYNSFLFGSGWSIKGDASIVANSAKNVLRALG